ncbi:MAG: hypothetical protein MUW56_20625 [Chryseobacterium sp.]|uniref:hypothetical protein n=1 Tax=Chryseobacterium sp. TaxID=1871047 RepID=UPI0025C2A459|nr:hypothetical protein [Chryseobacterium sp.]MCJ7935963.1 hypothetical protein [Chryseobacterium sp.]
MKNNFLLLSILGFLFFPKAQVGINTTIPGSTLVVNGSMSTKYRLLAGSDSATSTDEYLDYKGASNITISLPAALSGNGNFGGRIYEIRNGSASSTITLQANGAETIDSQVANSNTIIIPAGYVASVKSNGATSGSTWILTSLGQSTVPVNQKVLKYATTTTAPINASTPTNSETCIGVICVRFAGTSPNVYQVGARFQFKFTTQNNYSFSRWLFGSGATTGSGGYGRGNVVANTYVALDGDGLTPNNDDMTSYIISAISSRKMYRVNTILSSDKTNPTTSSVVKIFVEELE